MQCSGSPLQSRVNLMKVQDEKVLLQPHFRVFSDWLDCLLDVCLLLFTPKCQQPLVKLRFNKRQQKKKVTLSVLEYKHSYWLSVRKQRVFMASSQLKIVIWFSWWIVMAFSIDPDWPFCIVFVHQLPKCWADFATKVAAEIARQTDLKSTFFISINGTQNSEHLN